ncbi:MAG TPA: HAMP domain-containing sensor histidine kinase [Thermoanaerobaculia bacterium]|jgi:signal transduction histidine kinase|nr:HAMP domain-containing sensor histidine kinase [Thermoanaerobaculia bacterium]
MTEVLRTKLYRSIFVKLLAIMLATAVTLLFMVGGFVWLVINPDLITSRRLIADYARALAATSPNYETAKKLAADLDLRIRYEGPDGTWQTSPGLPSIREVKNWRHDFYVAPAPRGGSYLISWELGRRMRETHNKLLWLLHFLMLVVVFMAYIVIRHALRPLRSLHQGVTRLSEGHLDVVVPSWTRDEFGVLTEAFNQMVRRIREMIRARDQLLLDVSHELRSPLTRMKVALALLPEGEKKQRIAADVSEMETMIAELLELERLREGRGISTERQNLVSIVREMAESFQDRPPGVRFIAAASEILVEIDGDKIRTVLRNLLENAVKYSLPDSRPVVVSVTEEEAAVIVRVADDGPGIPETDLASLFEPFFRVDRSRSKKSGGYGLGLSICKRIMTAHGGGVAAANNAGRGARFTLTLPKPA